MPRENPQAEGRILSPELHRAVLSKHDTLWNAVHSSTESGAILIAWSRPPGNEALYVGPQGAAPSGVTIRVERGSTTLAECTYERNALSSDPQLSEIFARQVLSDLEGQLRRPTVERDPHV